MSESNDINPDYFYVVNDAGSLYGDDGENGFPTETAAHKWALAYNTLVNSGERDGPAIDFDGNDDAIITGKELMKIIGENEVVAGSFDNMPNLNESAPRLRFKPDQFNEVPVSAIVTVPEKRGFELRAELQPDFDSDDPENYFTLDLYRFDKKTKSKQLLDTLGGIDTRDADYVNQLLQTMLDEQGLSEATDNSLAHKKENFEQADKPSLKRVSDHEYRNKKATVFKDTEWDEYVVQFWLDGKLLQDADYHTDDKGDAQGTAKSWISAAKSEGNKGLKENGVFVADLGVEVQPSRWYVISDSNRMYGGASNHFATKEAAELWVLDNPRLGISLGEGDDVVLGSDIIKAYNSLAEANGYKYKRLKISDVLASQVHKTIVAAYPSLADLSWEFKANFGNRASVTYDESGVPKRWKYDWFVTADAPGIKGNPDVAAGLTPGAGEYAPDTLEVGKGLHVTVRDNEVEYFVEVGSDYNFDGVFADYDLFKRLGLNIQ